MSVLGTLQWLKKMPRLFCARDLETLSLTILYLRRHLRHLQLQRPTLDCRNRHVIASDALIK